MRYLVSSAQKARRTETRRMIFRRGEESSFPKYLNFGETPIALDIKDEFINSYGFIVMRSE